MFDFDAVYQVLVSIIMMCSTLPEDSPSPQEEAYALLGELPYGIDEEDANPHYTTKPPRSGLQMRAITQRYLEVPIVQTPQKGYVDWYNRYTAGLAYKVNMLANIIYNSKLVSSGLLKRIVHALKHDLNGLLNQLWEDPYRDRVLGPALSKLDTYMNIMSYNTSRDLFPIIIPIITGIMKSTYICDTTSYMEISLQKLEFIVTQVYSIERDVSKVDVPDTETPLRQRGNPNYTPTV